MEQQEQPGKTCADCRHFRLHYIKRTGPREISFIALNTGHCGRPHLRRREADAQPCERFEQPEEEAAI